MNLRNCTRCGKMFRPLSGKRICPDCVRAELEEFQAVRDFLRKNPGANILDVSEATGVPVKKIQEYIREGRLVVSESAEWGVACEVCGAPVKTGRLCPKCTEKLAKEINTAGISNWGDRKIGEKMRVYRDKFRRW